MIFSCYTKELNRGKNKSVSNDELEFKISINEFDKSELWIMIHNKSTTKNIIVANPFNYPVTSFVVLDRHGKEFIPSKFKFAKDFGKETLKMHPNQTIKKKLNAKLNGIYPEINQKDFFKIIAIYRYKAYLNDKDELTDTLIVN